MTYSVDIFQPLHAMAPEALQGDPEIGAAQNKIKLDKEDPG